MKILKTNKEIQSSIIKTTSIINKKFKGEEIDLIALNDSPKYFIRDLTKKLTISYRILNLKFKNYDERKPSGEVRIVEDLINTIYNRHVFFVDGIIISGITHNYLTKYIELRCPKSISILTVGIKPSLLVRKIPKYYALFEFKRELVEGYGFGGKESKRKRYLVNLNQSEKSI